MAWSKTTFARNGAPCSSCGGMVQKGAEGWTDASQPKGQRVHCLGCGPAETVMPTPPADPVAGSSALRQDKRYRGDNNLKGAQGEYLMGTYLAADLAAGAHVLTDRKVPGDSEANIDHVVVASTGVWIIDSKKWTGEIRYRSPGFPSTDPRKCLTVDGMDRTSDIAKIYRLVIPVAQVIGDTKVLVHPVLAFVEATWGVKEGLHFKRGKGPYEHEGVLISGGHSFIKLVNATGPLTPYAVESLWRRLDAAMLPR